MSDAQRRLEESLLFLEQRADTLDELVRDLYGRIERMSRRIEAVELAASARDEETDDGPAEPEPERVPEA